MVVSGHDNFKSSNVTLHTHSESSEVSDLQFSSPNDATLTLSWNAPAVPNGGILGYSVLISNLNDGSTVRQGITTSTSVTESDLGT